MKRIILLPFLFLSFVFAEPDVTDVGQGNSCYKKRDIPYSLEVMFEGLKETLQQSRLNIVSGTRLDGYLTAKGNQYNEDTITELTVTFTFRAKDVKTSYISATADYNVMKKKSDIGQIGAAGVSLPIPVPLTGKFAVVGSGHIDSPEWYMGFYNSFDKVMFEERMKALE